MFIAIGANIIFHVRNHSGNAGKGHAATSTISFAYREMVAHTKDGLGSTAHIQNI
jgi:hypothetical protein